VRIGESEECGDGEENLPNYREVNPMRKNKRAHEGQDSGDNKRLRILLHKSLEPKSPEIKVIGAKEPSKRSHWSQRASKTKTLDKKSPTDEVLGATEPRRNKYWSPRAQTTHSEKQHFQNKVFKVQTVKVTKEPQENQCVERRSASEIELPLLTPIFKTQPKKSNRSQPNWKVFLLSCGAHRH
jgi:hypothetical protein